MFLYCIHLSIVNIVYVYKYIYIYIIDYIFYCRYMICVYVYIYVHYLCVYIYIHTYTCIHDHLPNIINQDSHFRRIPCQSLIGAK